MRRADFHRMVSQVIEDLPPEILARMNNVEVLVESIPTQEQVAAAGGRAGEMLLGLYEGIPLTERDSTYGNVLPDRITLFQRNLEAICRTPPELRREVRTTILHEIAHHFGIDENRLEELEY